MKAKNIPMIVLLAAALPAVAQDGKISTLDVKTSTV